MIITQKWGDFIQGFSHDWQCIIAFFVEVPFWVSLNFKKFITVSF
jgi:hypothetical protein